MMLYSTENAPKLFAAWIAAEKGDWSGIAMLSLSMDFMLADALNWGALAPKASSVDYVFESGIDLVSEFMPENSIIGAPGTLLGIGSRGWPTKLIPNSLRRVHYSETPTLLINGNIDVSTPALFGRDELLPYFKKWPANNCLRSSTCTRHLGQSTPGTRSYFKNIFYDWNSR